MVTMGGRDSGHKWPELAWPLSVEVGGQAQERKERKGREKVKKNEEEKIVFERIRTQDLVDSLSA